MDDVAGGDGVAGVDFLNEKKAVTWLRKQSVEVRCAIACRAALRVCANICWNRAEVLPIFTLHVFRALLASAVRGSGRAANVHWINTAESSADFAHTEVRSAYYAAIYSARTADPTCSAFRSAQFAHSAALSAAYSSDANAAQVSTDVNITRSTTSEDSRNKHIYEFSAPVWLHIPLPRGIAKNHQKFLQLMSTNLATWNFWQEWYLAMWEGQFTDWDLAFEIAEIPDEIWEQGAEAVAVKIEQIKRNQDTVDDTIDAASNRNARQIDLSSTSKENVVRNRDAIALSAAALIDQLDQFKERVRGLNHLEPDFRQELLDFIESLAAGLEALLANLPQEKSPPSEEEEAVIAGWLDEFIPLMNTKAKHYVSPENVSEAALPVSFILGFTAIGTLIAGPAGGGVGALVGGLITGQVKPGKAADELIEQSSPNND